MTPDPYHTPGYCGYCPQFKYEIGRTFGSTTHDLLSRPDVAKSGWSVLAEMTAPIRQDGSGETRSGLIKTRTKSWGDQKLVEKMIPGYTGYIPKGQHYFGSRYAEICQSAIADFESYQRSYSGKCQEMRTVSAMQSTPSAPECTLVKQPVPLKPKLDSSMPYLSPWALQHSISPHYMSQNDPKKYFMSGYTGFVPKSRKYMGKGYPVITNEALREHADSEQRISQLKTEPVTVHRPTPIPPQMPKLYPVEAGLVPNYTGHIPAQKFKYGMTFGHSTKNAARNAIPEVAV